MPTGEAVAARLRACTSATGVTSTRAAWGRCAERGPGARNHCRGWKCGEVTPSVKSASQASADARPGVGSCARNTLGKRPEAGQLVTAPSVAKPFPVNRQGALLRPFAGMPAVFCPPPSWMGLSTAELGYVLPNLGSFSSTRLGFVWLRHFGCHLRVALQAWRQFAIRLRGRCASAT